MVAMTVAAQLQIQLEKHMIEGFGSKFMELKWVRRRSSNTKLFRPAEAGPLLPIYISTDPRHIDPHRLRDLYADCNHSCHRFPNRVHSHGRVEPVDLHKLRIALSHSAVLVSVFCKPHHVVAAHSDDGGGGGGGGGGDFTSTANLSSSMMGLTGLLESVMPVAPFDGQLVGFGRAVTDCGLTASIYDVMCLAGYSVPAANGNW